MNQTAAIFTPEELRAFLPLSMKAAAFLETSRALSRELLSCEDTRTLIVVGPCSIHSVEEALIYAKKFKKLAKAVQETCHLVMRVYLEKPRSHLGWQGLINDPDLDGSCDIKKGLIEARKLLIACAELEVPVATEFLDPFTLPFLEEFISWGFIGARTTSSMVHRQLVSALTIPCGFKNSVDGNIDAACASTSASQNSYTFLALSEEGTLLQKKTAGNPHTHIVLRGSEKGPNCSEQELLQALALHQKYQLTPRILIDCAHGNSLKNHHLQEENFHLVAQLLKKHPKAILGMMLESYLDEGHQQIEKPLQFGKSLTDPCISFEKTAKLIESFAALSCSA